MKIVKASDYIGGSGFKKGDKLNWPIENDIEGTKEKKIGAILIIDFGLKPVNGLIYVKGEYLTPQEIGAKFLNLCRQIDNG